MDTRVNEGLVPTSIRCLGAAVIALYMAAFTPVPNALIQAFGIEARLEPADAIVVLGGGVRPDGTLSLTSLVRVIRGLVLYGQAAAPTIVFSGSEEVGTRTTTAEAATEMARHLGVPGTAVLADGRGRTTREEAEVLGPMLHAKGIRRILLVTGGLHLRRAVPLFERRGFVVLPAPADAVSLSTRVPEERLLLLRALAEEFIAGAYYRLAGYL
jgi:uncharacterized SAM-binding protein YcdF (DUF218 family)